MSMRPEKFIHQKESTEDRHKHDYSTDLYEEWIAIVNQGDKDIMDLDNNVDTVEIGSVILESVLDPEPEELSDFDDYDFGDQQPPVVVVDSINDKENATETEDNDDIMNEVAAKILMAFINIILSYTNISCPKLPKKLSILRQYMGVDIFEEGLKRYVACKKCHKIYTLDVLLANQQTLCHHIEYPQHPSSVGLQSYAMNSSSKMDCKMFRRSNFYEQINAWRYRQQTSDVYYDIYDGKMWSKIKDRNGETFVGDKHSIQFALNVDW
ncbi:hypothetical protein INT45_009560 [Circinella minor]|uniref:Uncharacterized protein n=1 Tax=Circinella minor TaxID=1195481 RepID=A0A8H7VAY5_9FUNG|nr:hypothetical protein INT45_009560 [Circinella minor]